MLQPLALSKPITAESLRRALETDPVSSPPFPFPAPLHAARAPAVQSIVTNNVFRIMVVSEARLDCSGDSELVS
jgi:hypothetical protein